MKKVRLVHPNVDRPGIDFRCLESIELIGFDAPRVVFRHIEGKRWEIKIKTVSGGYRIFTLPFRKERLF